MNIKALFQRRKLWTIALYKLKDESEIFELDKINPFYFIGERGMRRNAEYQATTADPFLFVWDDRLYTFYEIQTDFGIGEIWAHSMDSQGTWINHGQVLKEDFHLSYPQVFSYDGQVWMIPEAASSGKVWLYVADVFPHKWRRAKVLINEPLVDPSIIIQLEGIYLFGTTLVNELKLFFSPLLSQEFMSTGFVISSDKSISRNGGRPLCIQNVFYRVAQNCKQYYGQNISLLQIDELSVENYSEHMTVIDLFKQKPEWMELGYHHISTVLFKNEYFVAVDGMRRDKYLNTLLLAGMKVLGNQDE
jgi:hypothetical protein